MTNEWRQKIPIFEEVNLSGKDQIRCLQIISDEKVILVATVSTSPQRQTAKIFVLDSKTLLLTQVLVCESWVQHPNETIADIKLAMNATYLVSSVICNNEGNHNGILNFKEGKKNSAIAHPIWTRSETGFSPYPSDLKRSRNDLKNSTFIEKHLLYVPILLEETVQFQIKNMAVKNSKGVLFQEWNLSNNKEGPKNIMVMNKKVDSIEFLSLNEKVIASIETVANDVSLAVQDRQTGAVYWSKKLDWKTPVVSGFNQVSIS